MKDRHHANELRFQGYPTLRISGNDLFPEDAEEYGFSCRVYQTEQGLTGWPTILERLRALAGSQAAATEGKAA